MEKKKRGFFFHDWIIIEEKEVGEKFANKNIQQIVSNQRNSAIKTYDILIIKSNKFNLFIGNRFLGIGLIFLAGVILQICGLFYDYVIIGFYYYIHFM